ncbi:polymerase delta-interacting protein 2 [Willisornis vidua]|uniref:Polymerase delta-interacting protein 2 n=1 Tax=Willisornis vidua TaxID=1566151 RepID=A0ABQ9DCH3_9PASS|nr:polymerase delta-interacting protein 2 [Willisornis vidua]
MSAAPGPSRAPQPLLRFPEGAGGPGSGRAAGRGSGPGPCTCPCPGGPRKRRRTTFSRGQLSELERAFAAVPYPDIATRERLAELTQLPEAKIQLFLHSVFGYRGIVLFPWQARLYDRDVASPVTEKNENVAGHGSKEVKGKTHTYYQVLIDARDCPHISQRSQTEAVTFLANHDDSRALYAIPGLDYVSHEDILPYSSTDQVPIQHELFERFLMYDQTKVPPFVARDTLCAWQEKNHPWLELSDVHRETTENIRVTVIPFYMGMREAQNSHVYWWRYCIRLENLDSEVVQLRERHWRIFSLSGTLETVRGRGVVGRVGTLGREPVLSKEQPAFQYSSHVSLQASSGHMWGTFRFERPDGSHFDVRIPPFSLESNKDEKTPPSGLHW